MKLDEVPQDDSKSFEGQRKRLYARNADGEYTTALSSGWEAEDVVLDQAVEEYNRFAREARQRVQQGLSSPLEYHMYAHRMDITVLAQATGFFRWQVKRHLKPAVFRHLKPGKLQRYEEAFQMTADQLRTLPPDDQ
ncbi:hypothetical protein SAMN05216429_11070 [Marinobacter persicus]|uniref:Uncharacterized protein n=1 Tax=Marinobacter persicus TaxID=930118 RepID=A0A1I3WPQ4_9GAMM|nr:hypothetical protein [Marinobacter persicus]GHD48025.1 hypothetical protein GCM10008110_16510 [Marinobacter persicus]SFK09350.1 hypothetical protein SAMN05216429_11070 [Marinobacter persicus]